MMKKKLAVLTGAGVSAESGIRTFRGGDGLWENHRVEDVADIEGWRRNPQLVLDFYNERRAQLDMVRPNAAHEAIASLENDWNVTVITQNVDNLHERAGSTRVIHLHGELTKVRPENCCNEADGFSEETVFDIGTDEVHLGDTAPNGAQLRPHIVWFGEAVPKIGAAIDAVEAADVLLIVGTSLQVYPAAGLYRYAGMDVPIYIIDPNAVPVRDGRITHIMKSRPPAWRLSDDLCQDRHLYDYYKSASFCQKPGKSKCAIKEFSLLLLLGWERIREPHCQIRIGIMANPSVRRWKYPDDCRICDSLFAFYGL